MRFILKILFITAIFPQFMVKAQDSIAITKLPFNSNNDNEFSPFIYHDKIIFCSDKQSSVFYLHTDSTSKQQRQTDLYLTSINPAENIKPKFVASQLVSNMHEGPVCLSFDNKTLFFSRNINFSGKLKNINKEPNTIGIFYCDLNQGNASNIKAFKYNSKDYNVMHPAISNDGNIFIFASDMPGSLGGFDLYICYRENNDWSKPKNMGTNINTKFDDAFPFIQGSEKLYYSSKGRTTTGGFDIYWSELNFNNFPEAVNIGLNYNTSFDDFAFIIDNSLQKGYFSSNREGSDDIYSFELLHKLSRDCKEITPFNYCYEFFEEGTSETDLESSMLFEWDFGDGNKRRGLKVEYCFEKEGNYHVALNVIDSLTGEVYFSQAEYDLMVEKPDYVNFVISENPSHKNPIEMDVTGSYFKDYDVVGCIWEFGDNTKADRLKVNHIYLNPGKYEIKLHFNIKHKLNGETNKVCYSKIIYVK